MINNMYAYVPNTSAEPLVDYSKGLLHGVSNHHKIQLRNTKASIRGHFLFLLLCWKTIKCSLCTQTMKLYKTTLKKMTTRENEKKSIISFGDLLVFFLRFLCATVYKDVNKPLRGGATK